MISGKDSPGKAMKIPKHEIKDTYPMGIPCCGYANMGMPA